MNRRKWKRAVLRLLAGGLVLAVQAMLLQQAADSLVGRMMPAPVSTDLGESMAALSLQIASQQRMLKSALAQLNDALLGNSILKEPNAPPIAPAMTPRVAAADGDTDRERLLEDARRLAAAGDTVQARRTLSNLLLRYPDDSRGSLALGELLATEYAQDPELLRRAATLAATAERDSACAAASHALLGRIARDSGDPATAEYQYRSAVSLAPGKIEYNRRLAMVLYDEGKWQDALAQFALVVAAPGEADPNTRYCRAMTEANLGDGRRAAADLEALFADEPDMYGAAEAAAKIYSHLEEHEKAIELYTSAAGIRRSWQLMQQLGREQLAAGRPGAASSSFTVAANLLSGDPASTAQQRSELLRDLSRARTPGGATVLH